MLACEEFTKLVDCGSEFGQIDLDVAAFLGHLGGNADIGAAMAVIVEKRLAVEDAVLPGRDHSPRLLLRRVEDRLHGGFHHRRAELGKQSRQPPLAEMRRAQHRGEVAAEFAGVADVQRQQIEQIVAQLAGFIELDRRDAQAFLIDLGGGGIIGAMGGAADVALMRAHDGPEQPLVAGEDRHEGGQVRQMAAAMIGIVEQDDVARLHVLEPLLDRERRPWQRADMNRQMIGLRDQAGARCRRSPAKNRGWN